LLKGIPGLEVIPGIGRGEGALILHLPRVCPGILDMTWGPDFSGDPIDAAMYRSGPVISVVSVVGPALHRRLGSDSTSISGLPR
jgi:hypothetical protein